MKKALIVLILITCFSCKTKPNETNVSDSNKDEEIAHSVNAIEAIKLEEAVLAGGALYRVNPFPSKYITPRPVDIWLPENYTTDKTYAVLYMHDGQNLFDATTTWNKQEWMVDEIATKLMSENVVKDFIVVGIHNIPDIRWQDLFPQKAFDYLSDTDKETILSEAKKNNFSTNLNGDNYLKFLVEEVKPFIDATYSVNTDSSNTFVSGSSMGGLMAMYAISEYPDVFGGAAGLSTHWPGGEPKKDNPIAKAIFDYAKANAPNPKNHKLYFDFGTKTLDQFYPQYEATVNTIYKDKGYNASNFKNLKFEGTDHSELSWQKRFDIPLTFLLAK